MDWLAFGGWLAVLAGVVVIFAWCYFADESDAKTAQNRAVTTADDDGWDVAAIIASVEAQLRAEREEKSK